MPQDNTMTRTFRVCRTRTDSDNSAEDDPGRFENLEFDPRFPEFKRLVDLVRCAGEPAEVVALDGHEWKSLYSDEKKRMHDLVHNPFIHRFDELNTSRIVLEGIARRAMMNLGPEDFTADSRYLTTGTETESLRIVKNPEPLDIRIVYKNIALHHDTHDLRWNGIPLDEVYSDIEVENSESTAPGLT